MATKKATEDLSTYSGGRTSSSRQRIRELLDKQRVIDEARNDSNTDSKAPAAFKSDYGKMLWVFRWTIQHITNVVPEIFVWYRLYTFLFVVYSQNFMSIQE